MAALAYAHPAETPDAANPSKLAQEAARFVALRAETDRLMALELDLQERAVAGFPEVPKEVRDEALAFCTGPATVAYHDRIRAVDAAHGIPQVQTAWKSAMTAQEAVAARISELSPASIRDAALKHGVLLAAHLTEEGDVMDPDAFRHAMKRFQLDLERLASTIDT